MLFIYSAVLIFICCIPIFIIYRYPKREREGSQSQGKGEDSTEKRERKGENCPEKGESSSIQIGL